MPAFVWLVVMCLLALCAKAQTASVGDTHEESGTFDGNSWSVNITVEEVTNHGDGTFTVRVSATTTSSGAVIRGYQIYSSDGTSWSGSSIVRSTSVTGSSTGWTDVSGTTSSGYPELHLDIFGQDTGTDPTGSANKHKLVKLIGPDNCKITIRLKNTRQIPVKYKLMKNVGGDFEQVGGEVTLQPGQQLTETIDGLDCSADYKVISQIQDFEFSDGEWFVEEGAVITEDRVEPVPEDKVVPESEPDAPVDVPEPENAPGAPATGPADGGSVWRDDVESVLEDLLTKQVYREGIDKVTIRLDKMQKELEKLNDADVPTMSTSEGVAPELEGDPIPRVTPDFGETPSFFTGTVPTNVSSFSFVSPSISVAGKTLPSATFEVDLADYSTPVSIFRALCSCVMWVLFYLLIVKTIKGAAADSS